MSPVRSPGPGRSLARLLALVLLIAPLCSGCLSGMYGYMHQVEVGQDPSLVLGARTSGAGELVVELDSFEDARQRRATLVLRAEELDALLTGLPVDSRHRLPLPHRVLARARFALDPPADLAPGGVPVAVLSWKPWASDSHRNAEPEPSDAPLAVAWTNRYRTGSEQRREALYVQRATPAGLQRAVFVVEPYAPHGWDLALRIALVAADLVLIASLF